MSDPKLYAERDHIAQGEHYVRHVSAMTAEGLHSKSAIAGELAHRDIEIERLQATIASLRRDIADPPGDVQEAVLKKLGVHAEIERLRKDAERWQTVWACVRIAQHGDYVLMPDDPTGLAEDSIARAKFLREVDAAIDSAMQSAKE